jgi:hypothetical protein
MQLSKHYVQQIGFIQQQKLLYTVELTFSFFIVTRQLNILKTFLGFCFCPL